MSRTIVSIIPDLSDNSGNGDVSFRFRLESPPNVTANSRSLRVLECRHDDLVFANLDNGVMEPETVKGVGQRLFETLAQHDGVKRGIDLALANRETATPIYIYPDPPQWQVQKMPWETLYNADQNFAEQRFLALNPYWPIARIAGTPSAKPEILRTFKPPLKVMAILTAAGISAAPEWQALADAFKRAPANPMLQLLVCERGLKDAIDTIGNPNIKADFLESSLALLEAIDSFSPHILHFFCHGSTEGGPHLQLATLEDIDAGRSGGSVIIEPNQLIHNTHLNKYVWLLTLNCCKGTDTGGEVDSMASKLVADGFPAVVGMREVVDTSDAHLFSRTFYPEVLNQIEECVKAEGQQIEIEWAKALRFPREQICEEHCARGQLLSVAATKTKEWTLPVMYVRPEPFKLQVRRARPSLLADEQRKLQATIDRLREAREFLSNNPEMPKGAIDEIDRRISDVESELYL